VTPHLVCAGAADAIEFYKKAFNAVEGGRLPGPQGKLMHAMIRIEGSAVMLVDEMPEWGAFGPKSLKGSPVTIHLYVEDVDAFVNARSPRARRSRCPSTTRSGATAMAGLRTRSVITGRWPRTSAI